MHHHSALMAGTGEHVVAESELRAGTATSEHVTTGPGRVVHAVDTEVLDTTVISGRTSDALHELAGEHDITRTAVNTSFGIVPCSGAEELIAHKEHFATFKVATDLTYAGTSFSAPAVSLVTALDLSRGEPACEGGVEPERAHGEASGLPLAEAVARLIAGAEAAAAAR